EPTYAGVESVSGEAMVVRVVAKSAAEAQVRVGRRLRERLKDAFDTDGIAIPVVLRMQGQGGGAGTSGPTGPK
ncbi:MAG: Mechanosensitive ion channel family protein, partial [Actinomycetota bacterium]|nr:Mechanosensitive ion channel family protein [Actinomycetota bacterium]